MTLDALAALALFALVSSLSPGPNNLMLMASGVNFGFARTVPHMLGVAGGFVVMVVLVGLGLAGLLARSPLAETALRVACLLYLCWLAWRIAQAAAPESAEAGARPFSLAQAAAFQWVNPKAWAMALTALGAYAPAQDLGTVVLVALVFGAVNLPSVSVWVLMGERLRTVLQDRRRRQVFNWTMAGLLIVSAVPMVL